MDLSVLATVVLTLFLGLAVLDGVVLHLVVFKLHKVPEARFEHILHTIRTFLMAIGVALLFALPTAGALLWLGVAVVCVDFGLGLWDAFIERESRGRWGGLGRWESALHIALSVLHGAALALIVASRPAEAWSWGGAQWMSASILPWGEGLMSGVVPGTALLGVVHVGLMLPVFQDRPT